VSVRRPSSLLLSFPFFFLPDSPDSNAQTLRQSLPLFFPDGRDLFPLFRAFGKLARDFIFPFSPYAASGRRRRTRCAPFHVFFFFYAFEYTDVAFFFFFPCRTGVRDVFFSYSSLPPTRKKWKRDTPEVTSFSPFSSHKVRFYPFSLPVAVRQSVFSPISLPLSSPFRRGTERQISSRRLTLSSFL